MLKYKIPQVFTLTRFFIVSRETACGRKETNKKCVKEYLSRISLSTPSGIRTLDPLIKSQLLYQLS